MESRVHNIAFQEQAKNIYESLEGVSNSTRTKINGNEVGDLRIAYVVCGQKEIADMPSTLARLLHHNRPSYLDLHVYAGKRLEEFSVGVSLHTNEMIKDEDIFISNNPVRVTGKRLDGNRDRDVNANSLFEQTSNWLLGVINSYK